MVTNKEIENKIKSAFSSAAPDVFESVLCKCANRPVITNVAEKKKTNNLKIRKIISIAAAIAVVVTSGIVAFFSSADRVDSVISLDVNPSIELDINKKEKIVKAQALNQEAEKVLEGMDLRGSDISVAVNAVIGSMLRNGYIDELANSILISVDNKDKKKSEELKNRLSKVVSELLTTDEFEGAVISQTINKEDKTAELAEKYGITKGKAQLIQQIVKADSRYKFKDLVSLSINELNLILSGKKTKGTVVSNGKASQKQYIGKEKAKKIALKQANITQADISEYKCELDYKDGVMVYEIEFKTSAKKYEYDINAKSGKIIKSKVEQNPENSQDVPTENVNRLGENRAKEIALTRAGVSEAEIAEYECQAGIKKYEIKFSAGELKYSYEIDATTGAVIDEKREEDNNNSSESNQSDDGNNLKEYIDEDKAKDSAMSQVGIEAENIINFKCEIVTDKDLAVYNLEFCDKTGNKYTFKIDALTGEIASFSKNTTEQTENTETQESETEETESEEQKVTYIGRSKAREIALKNLGATISDVEKLKVDFVADKQPAVYKISFQYKNRECFYEIDGVTGKIVDIKKRIVDDGMYDTGETASVVNSHVQSEEN